MVQDKFWRNGQLVQHMVSQPPADNRRDNIVYKQIVSHPFTDLRKTLTG